MHSEKFPCSPATLPALLNIVELLGEITANFNLLSEVPRILVSLLPLERATFAVIRRIDPASIRLLVSAGYEAGADSSGSPAPVEMTATDSTAYLSALIPGAGHEPKGTMSLRSLAGAKAIGHAHGPVEIVRQIDAQHQLVLVLCWDKRMGEISVDLAAMFDTVCDALAIALRTLLAWWEQPALLGPGFTQITGMQWTILRALCSDLSEKELADSLKVSPHTLHSHIKRIYQKLGVRGRLQVVHIFQQAVRSFRAQIMQRSMDSAAFDPVGDATPVAPTYAPSVGTCFERAVAGGIWVAPNWRESCGTA